MLGSLARLFQFQDSARSSAGLEESVQESNLEGFVQKADERQFGGLRQEKRRVLAEIGSSQVVDLRALRRFVVSRKLERARNDESA
jgi:hypothetical protein